MTTTEPLRPPLEHEVCGTCRWWDASAALNSWSTCEHPHKRTWTRVRSQPSWVDLPRGVWTADGCQCWEARGEEEGER